MKAPKQITLRNPSPELTERLKAIARERGESLNTTILRLLEALVGVNERRRRLERYATWEAAEFDEFDEALRAQRHIDDRLWN